MVSDKESVCLLPQEGVASDEYMQLRPGARQECREEIEMEGLKRK